MTDTPSEPLTPSPCMHARTYLKKYVPLPLPLSGSFSLKTSAGYVPPYTLPAEHNLTCIITMLLFSSFPLTLTQTMPFIPLHSLHAFTPAFMTPFRLFASFCLHDTIILES